MYDVRRTRLPRAGEMPNPETIAHPSRDEIELAAVLHALSDPVRLLMVRGLAGELEGRSCGSFNVPVTKSTCTHHFKILREAGVIRQRQEGTKRVNTLREDDLEARFPGRWRSTRAKRRATPPG